MLATPIAAWYLSENKTNILIQSESNTIESK